MLYIVYMSDRISEGEQRENSDQIIPTWARLCVLFLMMTTAITAYKSNEGATAVMMAKHVAQAVADARLSSEYMAESMPFLDTLPVEGHERVLQIQRECLEMMGEPEADLCVQKVAIGGKYYWVGKLGLQHNPGTVVSFFGDGSDYYEELFTITVDQDNNILAPADQEIDERVKTFSAWIGSDKFASLEHIANDEEGIKYLLKVPTGLMPEDEDPLLQHQGLLGPYLRQAHGLSNSG